MANPNDPLVLCLRRPECRPLLNRLQKKLELGEPLVGKIRLNQLAIDQRRRIGELTGSKSKNDSISVDLDAFRQVIENTGRFQSLTQLIELAVGHPIENRRASRQAFSLQWQSVWDHSERLINNLDSDAFDLPGIHTAINEMKRGWLSRVCQRDPDRAKILLIEAFRLLEHLPVEPTPLAIFAAKHTANAHSLDSNQPLSRLMIRLISAARSIESIERKRSSFRRNVWQSVGIVTDELSSSVLVLNLTSVGNSLVDQMLLSHANHGMPCRITFRHLRLHAPEFAHSDNTVDNTIRAHRCATDADVFVCENPSVIAAAADELGASCPPMVCVEGHPSLACVALLGKLRDSGFCLNYHGDFDWGGIRVANEIYRTVGFRSWRFSADDYKPVSSDHRPLVPPQSEALWDVELSKKIGKAGLVVEEESTILLLLEDLKQVSRRID
jgi:uncharacterized protein (TIGR02679 family)